MKFEAIFRVVAKILIPLIVLFAFYVHFHGDFSPGGGFQAGVMIAAAAILYAVVFGVDEAQSILSQRAVAFLAPFGVLLYAAVGLCALLSGKNFLDYTVLAHHSKHAHHIGILLIEIGVIITVSCTMIAIFYAFVDRSR
ncbi:MAG: Na(+)/H(+) antiporter subunit B [Hyphomicrobiaceae bacterium]|nr:Na(+)/H(+) antiporter subunit B [Hyphomicrobiaceae bacterium]